jgi:HSP20 family protein
MRLVRYTYPTTRNFSPVYGALPRSPWSGLETELDRLFESALSGMASPNVGRFPVDLYEDKDNTYVRAELPGVNREDIGVELVEGQLNLTAQRKTPAAGDQPAQTYTLNRSVTVPDAAVQVDRITAAYENGILTVTLPKREESKPRKVTVAVK